MHLGFAQRRPGFRVALAVAALHGLLGLALLGTRAWPDRERAVPQAALVVRLLATPAVAPLDAPAKSATAPQRRPDRPSAAPQSAPQAITLPAAVAPTVPAVAAPAGPLPGAGAPLATVPLLLDLPRAASTPDRRRNPALDDPRANSPRPTLEARIAGALGGDDRLIEEPLGDGRVRYRRGAECILVQPARGAQIDPFNQSANPVPRLVGPC